MADDDGNGELTTPEKSSAWSDEDRERKALPPAPAGTAVPDWAETFRPGDVLPLRGWNCRIVGGFLDDDGVTPLGFALVPESMTAAELKRRAIAKKRSALKVVR